MLIKKNTQQIKKLSFVFLKYRFLSAVIGLSTFLFLYVMTTSIGETYPDSRGDRAHRATERAFPRMAEKYLRYLSILTFIILFVFMLGQRLSYLLTITKGIDKFRENRMYFDIKLEGNDDLTRLLESINYLAASRREMELKEKRMKVEGDARVRSLSHDIRTPTYCIFSSEPIDIFALQNKSARISRQNLPPISGISHITVLGSKL